MDPTEELDLGASDYTEEEEKSEELFGGISANKPFHPLVHEPVQDSVQQYYTPPSTPEAYQDYKKLTGELSALSSDASGLGQLRKARGDALDDFMSSTIAPFYRETLGEGMLDATKGELDDPDSLFQRFDDHFSNPDFQSSLPKYSQIKDKYGRLKSDFSRYSDAEQNALSRKDFLTRAKYSMPETFRRAADNYKAEKLTDLSDKAVNDLLDTQEFEEPVYGREGLLNEDKLDPRAPHQGPLSRTGDPSKKVRDRQSKKLLAVKKEGIKALQNNLALEKRDEGLRSQGINFSELGKFAGYPLYMNQGERQILNLEKAKTAGATSFRGQPIEQAFEQLGGEDKLIASKMVETVFNAYNMVQDSAVSYWSDQTPENKEKFELAKKVHEESWAQAARMGLGNEIPERGDTVGFWAGLGNAFKRGDLQEDLSDFTPALLGAIDVDTAQQIIDIMEQTEELGMSSAYKNIKATKSEGIGEAFGKIFSNPSAIPEMVVETLTAFFSAWATEAPKTIAAGAASGAAIGGTYGWAGGPKGAAGGAIAGAGTGAAWGLRLSAGAASFALEYAGEVLNEMGEMGIDWKNPHIFVAAWNNPKIREKIRAKAAKYAGGIALMDTVAAGVVGRVSTAVATKRPGNLLRAGSGWAVARSTTRPILNPGGVTRTSRNVGRVAELGAQSGLGMSGEALGQIWSRDPGDPLIRDWDALAAEGLIEFAGPGGVGVVANLINSKASSYNYGVYGYEEVVSNNITKDNGTVVEDVDKGGLKFQRQFFENAETAEAELSQAGVNFNSVEGRVLKMLLLLMGGRLKNMGFAFSERSPTRDPSPGVYDQTTGTIFINLKESANHALTILHESGHFIEQMFPNINVKELYDQLTPEEKENHWASYMQQTEAKFKDLSKLEQFMYKGIPIWRKGEKGSARAASEWFAHMVVRVLTGVDQGVDTKIKSAVKDFTKLFEDPEIAAQFLGSQEGGKAREMLAAVLMRALGVDANGAAYDLQNFYNLLEDENPRDSGIYPAINFGQNVNEWTQEQRDLLAVFLGYYKGWSSISRSDQNSIAQWVAGSDLLSKGIQERGASLGDARSEGGLLASGGKTLAGSANEKPAPRQTKPGVHPDLKKRGGRAPGGPSLGAKRVEVDPDGRPKDPFEAMAGITSGRLEEEEDRQRTDKSKKEAKQQPPLIPNISDETGFINDFNGRTLGSGMGRRGFLKMFGGAVAAANPVLRSVASGDNFAVMNAARDKTAALEAIRALSLEAQKVAAIYENERVDNTRELLDDPYLAEDKRDYDARTDKAQEKAETAQEDARYEAYLEGEDAPHLDFEFTGPADPQDVVPFFESNEERMEYYLEQMDTALRKKAAYQALEKHFDGVKDVFYNNLVKLAKEKDVEGIREYIDAFGNPVEIDHPKDFDKLSRKEKRKYLDAQFEAEKKNKFWWKSSKPRLFSPHNVHGEGLGKTPKETDFRWLQNLTVEQLPSFLKRIKKLYNESWSDLYGVSSTTSKPGFPGRRLGYKEAAVNKEIARLEKAIKIHAIKVRKGIGTISMPGGSESAKNALSAAEMLLFAKRTLDNSKASKKAQIKVIDTLFAKPSDAVSKFLLESTTEKIDAEIKKLGTEAKEVVTFEALFKKIEAMQEEQVPVEKKAGLEPKNEIQVDPEKGPLGATKLSREVENLLKLSVLPSSEIQNPKASALDLRIKKAQAEIRRKQVPGYSQKEISQLAENPLYVVRHMLDFRVDKQIRGYLAKRKGQSMQSLSMVDVDTAVGEYMDAQVTQQLSQQAPEVEVVIPFGVHTIDISDGVNALSPTLEKFEVDVEEPVHSQRGDLVAIKKDFSLVLPTDTTTFYSHNPVYEAGYQLESTNHIGSLGDLVNIRVPRDREDGKPGNIPINKDSKHGKPFAAESIPDSHYAFEIVATSSAYEHGTLVHRYLLVSRSKEEATKNVPWHDVPLSRFSNTRSSYYKYHINPADREVYGDFVQKRGAYVVRQYATIYDALQDKVVKEIGVKTRTSMLGQKYKPSGKPIEELAKLSGSAVNKGQGTQKFTQGPAFRVGGRNKEAEIDQLSIEDSTLILNMAFATIETGKSNEISRNDISKAYGIWNRALKGHRDVQYSSLINWNNYRTLNPEYLPINTTAALIQRVMSLMGKSSLPEALAPSDLVLLDAAGISNWAKDVSALQPLLEKEGVRASAENEAYFTALKRLIVLAGHDISRMGDSQGNVHSQLIQNNNEDRYGFSSENTPREDMPFPRVTYKRKDPPNKEVTGPDEIDAKELEERGLTPPASFEPVISFDLTTYYGESQPGMSKGQMDYDPMEQRNRFTLRVDGQIVDNLTGKTVKSAKFLSDYMADELEMDLGATSKSSLLKNHNNIKDIGKLDFFTNKWEYIGELRYEKDHSQILREKSEKDYEPGAPTVELIQFLDDVDASGSKVGVMGTSKVGRAEKDGKGISLMRKEGIEHFGNPFVYTTSAKSKDTVEVLSRQKAIEYFALWLFQDQIEFEFSEEATVSEYSHKLDKKGEYEGFIGNDVNLADIEPERRKWILDQINSGKLDGKTLLYSAGSEGNMGANHAVFLQQYINAVRPQKEAPDWAIDWALGKTEEEGYYNWVLAVKKKDVGSLIMGKQTNIVLPEDKQAILGIRSLLGESGKSEIHDRPVFSDQEETPLSASNKVEKFTLASSQTPDTQNKLGRDQDRSIAGGLSRGLKWADRMLLAYFRADPSVQNPEAKLLAITSTYGKIFFVSASNFENNNKYYKKKGLPLLKSEYFGDRFDQANQEKFILDAKLLLVRKLVADSHGLTERYNESIEVKASEDTSVESQVDASSDDEVVGGQKDQSRTTRSELMGDGGIQDDSSLSPAEALEQQEESAKDLSDIIIEALNDGAFGSDDLTMVNAFKRAVGEAEITPTEEQTAKVKKKDKDPKSFPLSSFIQKQLLKSIKDGTDTTIITNLARALVQAKKVESLDKAESLIRQQLNILQDNNYKFTPTAPASKEDTLVFEKATPTQGLVSITYPTQKYSGPVSGSKAVTAGKFLGTKINAKGIEVPVYEQIETTPSDQSQFEFKSLEDFVQKLKDELIYEVGKADDKKVRLRNNGFLGASFLTSELRYSLYEKLRAGVMMYGKAAWDRLPENAKYAFRVSVFSQYISAEDLHARLLHAMEFKEGQDAQDFFDLQGHIIRNFATVKNSSDLWRAEFREPIQEYLMEHGVDPEEWGAVAIALASGNLNRYLERKLKEAHENSYSVLHGELKYDTKTRKEYRKGGILKRKQALEAQLNKLKARTDKDDAKVKNSIKTTEKKLADIKSQVISAEKKVKEIDLKSYYNDSNEFVGSGMSNAEAINAYKALIGKDNIKSLLENTDIFDKFRDLNLAVIIKLGTSGFITNDQVFRMFITHYRPEKVNGKWASPEQAYKNAIKFLESRGVQLDNTQIETDYSKLDPKIKGAWEAHYKESKEEVDAGLPAGYWYSPTAGFADVEGFWQTQEELAEIFGDGSKTGTKSAGRGIEASRAQRLFQFSTGRKVNTAPPDPKSVLPIVFSSAENVLIRISKKPSSDHVIALYRLFLDLYENQNNFEGYASKHKAWQESDKKGNPPSSIQALLEAKGLEGIFQNENQLKILFEELDDVFDYMNFDKEKGHPIEDVVEAKEIEGADGVKRLVVRHVMRRVDDKDGTIFIGREGGERVYAKFKENKKGKRFASEVKNMNHVPLWKILHNSYYSLNSVTRFMSMMFTSWNPDFLFTNQVRDAMNALLNMSEQSNEKFKKSLKSNYIKKVASSTKGIWRSEWRGDAVKKREKIRELGIPSNLEAMVEKFGTEGTDSDFYLAWWLYLDSKGLKTSFVKPESMEDIMREIDETFKDATQTNAWSKLKGTKGVETLKRFGDRYVDPVNTGIENSVRVVVAVEAIKAGMTEHQAITLGRRVSVDFNRKGNMSANLGALFVFFNAGVQGNLRFFRSLFMRSPKDQLKMVGGIAGVSYLWAWMQMLISGDEEEENFSHYDQISDVKKNGNIVAFMPGSKKHVTIPLPYGWNWIWAIGQIGAQASAKSIGVGGQGKGLLAGAKDLMAEGYKQFVPIDSPMPTVAQPYFDLKNNKNFFGAPIEKVAFPFDPPNPQAYMSRKGTASFWKNLAISMNSISGGDEVTPGSLKRMFGDNSLYNSPENDVEWALSGSAMEYIFNSLGGGAGATFSRVVSGAWGAAQGDFTVNWEQVPMLRRFYRDDYSSWKTLERFFSLRDRVNMANKYVKMLEKGGAPAKEASKAIKLNKNLITIKGMVDAADTQRKALKRKSESIEKSKLSDSEKRDRLEKIEKQTLATYRKVLLKASKMGIEI